MMTAERRDEAPIQVYIVTGAPGAGKSSVAQALLDLGIDALVFDADQLLEPTSDLVGRPMTEAADLWPTYDRLWVAILSMVVQNRHAAVLLTPMEPRSLPAVPWPERVGWCLLDCDDETRTARLNARGWSPDLIADALADARTLRDQVRFVVDTSHTDPREAAARVADWVRAPDQPAG
jgi:chloramphenicol 3-O-phosphotransferase